MLIYDSTLLFCEQNRGNTHYSKVKNKYAYRQDNLLSSWLAPSLLPLIHSVTILIWCMITKLRFYIIYDMFRADGVYTEEALSDLHSFI